MIRGPEDWAALDRKHVWHPYTQHGFADVPVPIVRGEGSTLFDGEGRPILDAISSWWVTLFGHGRPEIADSIAAQARTLEQVIFAGFTHEPGARLASELTELLPPALSKVFYSDDGSTAVEVAVKMALQYWMNLGSPRSAIVAMENAYHGDTFGAMSVSARSLFTDPFRDRLFEVIRLPDPCDGDAPGALRTLLEARGEEVGAVIVEPRLLGAGGMRVWGTDALLEIRELTRRRGILLIADEVLTGFGRTGPLFACGGAGVEPDLLCLSKGLTGGFLPLGVTVATDEVFEAFRAMDRRKTFFHGHSYTGNPLACAAARATLTLLDSECAARRAAIEEVHRSHLERLSDHPRVRRPRVLGTIAAFDLAGEEGYLAAAGPALSRFALERGVLLRPLGNVVYLLPPYCFTDEELGRVYGVIEAYLEAG